MSFCDDGYKYILEDMMISLYFSKLKKWKIGDLIKSNFEVKILSGKRVRWVWLCFNLKLKELMEI